MKRNNHQAYTWKHAHVAMVDLPDAMLHGWQLDNNDKIEPRGSTLPVLPKDIVDLLDAVAEPVSLEQTDFQGIGDSGDVICS